MTFFQFCNYLLIAVVCSPLSVFAASNEKEDPVVFPNGAKSLFIGHSFFVPIADRFDDFGRQGKKKYTNHNVQTFKKGGAQGSPVYLWENHKPEIENILKSEDIKLFGLVSAAGDGEMPVEDAIKAYTNWIDLALSYNDETSIFIGAHWSDFPANYTDANAYDDKIQENADTVYSDLVVTLRELYPENNIFFLNYGIIAAEMRTLFEKDELVDITAMIGPPETSIFRDTKGHAGTMLLDFAGFTWLHWFYGTKPNKMIKKGILSWDEKAVKHVLRKSLKVNKDYRLFED